MSLALPLGFLVAVLMVLFNYPVGFAFGAGVLIAAVGAGLPLEVPFSVMYSNVESFALLALPLFIYLGILMERSGLGERLTNFCAELVGGVRGGMGIVVVFSCAIFGAVSGAGSAAVASVGSVLIPRAVALGYPRGYMVGLVACSSVLTLLIPPSIPMLVLALTLRISIAAAFLTTIIPALLIAVGYSIVNMILVRRMKTVQDVPMAGFWERRAAIAISGRRAFWPLLVAAVVLGSIYGGIASPTEAAALGTVYVAAITLLGFRSLSARSFFEATWETGRLIGALMLILASLLMLSNVLINEGVPFEIADLLKGDLTQWQLLIFLNLILLGLGMVMDDISGSILAASILYPIASEFGIHPLHFAAIVGVNLGLGNVTPPVAPLLYLASGVGGNVPLNEYLGTVMRLLLCAHLPVLLLVTYVPDVALWLPRLAGLTL